MKTEIKKNELHQGTSMKPLVYYKPEDVEKTIRKLETDVELWEGTCKGLLDNANFWRKRSNDLEDRIYAALYDVDYWKLHPARYRTRLRKAEAKYDSLVTCTLVAVPLILAGLVIYLHAMGNI